MFAQRLSLVLPLADYTFSAAKAKRTLVVEKINRR
jgi:hypothetical protein